MHNSFISRNNTNELKIFELFKSDFKTSDHARRQGAIRFKSGAYTAVRESRPGGKSDCNTAFGYEMGFSNHF